MTHRLIISAAAGLLLASCQSAYPDAPQVGAISTAPAPAFVEAACGGCHAVEPPFLSPNATAPSFESIANRPGVTRSTIQAWLRNAHNYPEQMDFDLTPDKVNEVSNYMITLKRRDYVPVE
ncbi:hypothetical protein EH31_12195 [Erythrobacter longus]|uniref:Cytochrome c domain-containing protein n=1 Tax=Erythrobacter longus TaxID=1044 RepID=A0A074M9F5_ERYLO|nr:hypothetical protein [Erythrobacter longus]KEO89400.1 hypothetical protein EH31_12195 [Erythrobacter longus]